MGRSTFSGPLRSGTVINTTGNTPGTVDNTGLVTLTKSFTLTAAELAAAGGAPLKAMLPKGSQILLALAYTTEAFTFTGGTTAISVALGATPSNDALGSALNLTAAGGDSFEPPNVANWVDVNVASGTTTDVPVYAVYSFIGGAPATIPTGAVTISLLYVQTAPIVA